MQVLASTLQMSSAHVAVSQTETRERLRIWIGERPGDGGRGPATPAPAEPRIDISDAGRSLLAGEAAAIDDAADAAENDPMLGLLRRVIEWMTGRRMDVIDMKAIMREARHADQGAHHGAAAMAGAGETRGAGFGIEYDAHYRHSEVERTSFAAEGIVVTGDGQQIRFSVSLSMAREYHEESHVSLRAGDAVMKDPLVINFSGAAAQLSDQTFSLDLDRDGTRDTARFVSAGSGFLVFDRNGDGQVNDGSELFGPATGNGFAELAALDSDGSGWIDEGDADFDRLAVWTQAADGTLRLDSLAARDVGALFTGSIATPFALKDASNTRLGQVVGTGLYLGDAGRAGTLQQIDLAV